ncbi:ketopantoate hydroxymethyltransferase [Ephemerocybe angulata]|uniref:3-methyl-2-oxobutanoate hydroxymethyltransferase n=1 Tax=Ephemerocybe angulata TaxID=980116 RepID=A0A8H6I4S1_9AGAR|nr:ketopantoate hydroxymethyltransferase [Tulosesus angulatus]
MLLHCASGRHTTMLAAAAARSATRTVTVSARRHMSVRPEEPKPKPSSTDTNALNQPPVPRKKVCLGLPSTTQLTLDEMIHHSRAVTRGTTHPLLVADMPFGSYQVSSERALLNALRLIKEAHVEAVKLEGGAEIAPTVRRLVDAGIPVMAHIGLQPQKHTSLSGYKVQGRSVESARRLIHDALALEEAGAFSTVVEAVPRELGKYVTEQLKIPTIGIGAGPWTSGQVLVLNDLLGTWSGHKAKFVRRFANLKDVRDAGIHKYAEAVRDQSFPDPETESYTIDPRVWERFLEAEQKDGRGI